MDFTRPMHVPSAYLRDTTPVFPAVNRLPLRGWHAADARQLPPGVQQSLEVGQVLHFPALGFALSSSESALLKLTLARRGQAAIYLHPHGLRGAATKGAGFDTLRHLLLRYREHASCLLNALFPDYAAHRHTPATLLHIQPATTTTKPESLPQLEASTTHPLHGERILRVFTNIHPDPAQAPTWRIGPPFEHIARRYLPKLEKPWRPWLAGLMHKTRHTRQRRTEYDHLMLQLRDHLQADARHHHDSKAWTAVNFLPGSTWMCFSDQVAHAAWGGQYVLEQRWQIPLAAMAYPELAPVRVLERLAGRWLLAH